MTIKKTQSHRSFHLKLYFFSYRCLQKIFLLLDAGFQGFWLGVSKRETLHHIDQFYYNNSDVFKDAAYLSKNYNQQGLWEWEKNVIEHHFSTCRHLLLLGAGGGREVIALSQLGYQVHGFECNPQLVEFASQLLQELGCDSSVQWVQRDQCPPVSRCYDGVIIGWGAYMLIQGKEYRIDLLKQLREAVPEGSPILLSFFYRSPARRRYFKAITIIANTLRGLLRREQIETGDALVPNFAHCFVKEEILDELNQAGFQLEMYDTNTYGHAVGIAV
jgi:hypothetical protein